MKPRSGQPAWTGWFLKRKQVIVTTWKFRLLGLLVAASAIYLTYPGCLVSVAAGLVHEEKLDSAQLLVLENFDADYFVFEAARGLLRSGHSSKALVPVVANERTMKPGEVQLGFTEVMSRIAGIDSYEIVAVRHTEPVSLTVALQVANLVESQGIESVIVVSPRFRSARSYLVYDHVLTPRGIRVQCLAASGPVDVATWWHTWHGIQDVGLEYSKLLYYRFWVL